VKDKNACKGCKSTCTCGLKTMHSHEGEDIISLCKFCKLTEKPKTEDNV